jgi:hypothetical protein
MPNNVKIGGVTVDADDPCALYTALYNVRLKLIAGEKVADVWIQDFNGQRRTRFADASIRSIDEELARLKTLCSQTTTGRKARFAISAGFRRIP